ncbi:MFS transporter, partial [Bacillus cereus]|nr:MFS transporter [Bacillus cereus]
LNSSMRFIGVADGPHLYSFFMKGAHNEVFYLTSIFAAIGAVIEIIWIKPAKDAKTVKQKPEPTS